MIETERYEQLTYVDDNIDVRTVLFVVVGNVSS